jgi:hypothetical protein
MRKSLGTALVLGFVTIAATAVAQTAPQEVRVTAVDRGSKGFFSAQWFTGSGNFWISPRTTFHVGSQRTTYDYFKTGSVVRVSSHMEGDKAIADDVMFIQ